MQFGSRLAVASAIALLAGASTAWAAPIPPKSAATFPGVNAAPVPGPAVPTFVNGMAQNVFSASSADWISGEVWVESDFDSDGDGKKDRMHADYTLPEETATDGLKVPVIFEDSPYYAGTGPARNWLVDHELGATSSRGAQPFFNGTNTSPTISTRYEADWLPRGFAVVHSESPGTGYSDGCPTSGAPNETLGATTIVDWLNGRRKAYTTRTGDVEAPPVNWHNGNTGMMGTSYNGTIPIAAASTGVEGLKAIVPISAISDWYDYYRANGAVRAPSSSNGGMGNNSFQGEDLDVLADLVYSRRDEQANPPGRVICRPLIDAIKANVARETGDRTPTWQERNYMTDVQAGKLKAATLIAHGGNDFNVMTENASQLYDELKKQNIPHQFYFHQGGHGGAPPDFLLNLWFTKYLWGQNNGVENQPKSWVVREAASCPPRESTVTTEASNTGTLTVASSAAFRVGNTLTIPQTNASGTITNTTRVITNIAGNVLTLASPVATAAGQRVVAGAVVNLVCNTSNPTPYAEWPDPATADVTMKLRPAAPGRGFLSQGLSSTAQETFTDDSTVSDATMMNTPSQPNRLIYLTNHLTRDIRISGSPRVTLRAAFSKRANFTAVLVSLPASGNGTILTRGWMDPENPVSDSVTVPTVPGEFRTLTFAMQAKDTIVQAGRRIGLMVYSTDRQYHIRPAPGAQVTLDLAGSSFTIPVVGGASALGAATGEASGDVGGTVPATLALTLGAPANFGPFTPGVAKEYTASTTATVISTAGDAALTVTDPSSNHTDHL
ncbi:MAG TPA: CocE/NonD family hydrolase, partial [Candidatus Limnocylindrales bacterium]|nr:CocE/NonD family hydrolase [Candidatus Limnocylindrales bacterium]